jgi:molybdopterin-guanine dinucleotide biosynthesis protein A
VVPLLSGVLLAGGHSTRMGMDKALLEIDGEPLARRAAGLLVGLCDDVVVASGEERRLSWLGLPQVPDIVAGAGPLGGIVAGLRVARHPLVAVLAVDMPAASAAVLRLLAAAWRGEPAVVPKTAHGLEPLHAVYAASAADALSASLRSGQRSMQAILTRLGARVVESPGWQADAERGGFASNLNTPSQARAWKALPPGGRPWTQLGNGEK